MKEPVEPESAAPSTRSRITPKSIVSWLILVVTVAAVARQVKGTVDQFDGTVPKISLVFLAVAAGTYLIGWCLLSIPWLILLRHGKAPWPAPNALRTYLISHLGKYVPGKAMVVLIRCNRRPRAVPLRTPIIITVHETLFAMATAALTGCICIALLATQTEWRALLAKRPEIPWGTFALATAFSLAASPSVFGRLNRAIERKYGLAHVEEAHARAWRSFFVALAGGICSWFVQGLSYLLIFVALDPTSMRLSTFAVATTAFSVSVIVGFLSMAPGQIGVREWVLIEMVTPFVPNRGIAVLAPLLHRMVTLGTEIVVGSLLALGRQK